ncbi:LysR substrate-binding domain-containing protein [Chelatococcus sp. SYSU_G07232]|uniref:LysR substrate-binding domain-containing protein n=1 Tax=Chelatococcus albus TaxID=3047466 RepID=A0ABT7AF94_9HYPH|nr:LysR substrate-binding domain-containing protein [Chelatococcus sp. SYSU_G07232]MDJ1158040.1 LysR substrate-binding domain-containing protein [Chelatococcus sp. SYSU_G07232]
MQARTLPSTTALRVLVALAEHGSASEAAKAVHLTQSAVSKQLKGLEESVGMPLFLRNGRGLTPTEAGQIYVRQARVALGALEAAAARVAALRGSPHSIRLHVLPILGDRWLVPRFSRFTEQHPGVDVQFTTFVTSTMAEEADAVFRFGEGHWPGQDADYLFGRNVALVAAPQLLQRMGGIETADDVRRYTVLDHFQTPLRWSEFAEAQGLTDFTPAHTVRFGFYALVIRAAIAGQGLALVPRSLIADELAAGRLVNPNGLGFFSRHGYWLTVPNDRPPRPGLVVFRAWLLEEARALGPDA